VKIIILSSLLGACLFWCRETIDKNFPKRAQLVFIPKFDGLDAFLNYQEQIEQRKDLQTLPLQEASVLQKQVLTVIKKTNATN
jgi:hypothetical protein